MKIAITMPPLPFRIKTRVIYADTDAGGVVYHAAYLRFFESARTEMIRHWNYSYRDMVEKGLILPVTESYLRYKAPALYDDLLITETALVEVKKVSCRFNYRILRAAENAGERLLVQGFTTHACVGAQGRLRPFPAEFVRLLEQIIRSQNEK